MIKLSKFPFKTMKSRPKVSDNESTGILLQAGFIRQVMAGVYTYTTLGQKVLNNISNIIRDEMDKAGCFEVYMPGLSPKELWVKTGKWDVEDYFKVEGHGGKEYRINPTHEEVCVDLMKDFINSYKDSDTCVYQVKDKYRNEKRAKSGILRGRDFIMKDAYSFHVSQEDFENFYEMMKGVYKNIFKRLGLGNDTYITVADGGVFTEKYSHEFQTILQIGEDTIYIDKKTGESFNQEVAPSLASDFDNSSETIKDKVDILGEGLIGVDALSKFLDIPVELTTKTMIFEDEKGRIIATAVRGDYDINILKLKKVTGSKELKLASEDTVEKVTGCVIGYAGMINLSDNVIKFWDNSCKNRINFEMGANKKDYHSINVNFGKDVELPEEFYDFKDAKEGDRNPSTGNIYEVHKASEVGNIFPLETGKSKPFGFTFMGEDNKQNDVIMGCYGIGISRVMGVIAEYFMSEKGIIWPENIAPADYYIIVMGEENLEKAEDIAKKLESEGNEVILDDRFSKKIGFGQKAADCELFGIPNRIVISPKTIETGGYELKKRGEKEKIITL